MDIVRSGRHGHHRRRRSILVVIDEGGFVGIYAHSDLRRANEERLREEQAKAAKAKTSHMRLTRLFEDHKKKRPPER